MKKVEKIKLLLRHPVRIVNCGLNIYKEELYHSKNIKSYNIEQLPTIDICDLIPDFGESLNNYTFLDGVSLVTDIALLKSLARSFNNCAYLEIGSWRGESISNVYEVTKDCTSITLSEEEMKEMKFNNDFIKVHGIFSNDLEYLKIIKHNSQTFDFSKFNKTFDLIFIDGDHSYQGCKTDINAWVPHMKSHGVIFFHDADESSPGVLQAACEFVNNHKIEKFMIFKKTDKNTSVAGIWL